MIEVADGTRRVELIEKLEQLAIMGILFFIPSSPAAPNLLGVLLIVLWLLKGQYQASWLKVKGDPVFWAFMAYLVLYPLSLLWTQNLAWGQHIVERHLVFLMFPFIYMAAKFDNLPKYLAVFIAGITLTEFVSYAVWFEWLHLEGVDPSDPVPFYMHTEYNPILAWALYLVMHGLLFEKHRIAVKVFYAAFAVTMTINMFITGGRAGQLTYFVIMLILFMQFFYKKGMLLRGVIAGALFTVVVFFSAYQTSPLFKERVNLAVTELQNYTPESHGSVSYRLQLYSYSLQMSFDRPLFNILLGTGVGGFPEAYMDYVGDKALIRLAPSTHNTAFNTHTHPHSQYIYELGALGMVGLLVLLSLFVTQFWRVYKERGWPWNDIRLAFVLYAMMIQVTDSLLLAFPTALLFVAFSAILFGAKRKNYERLA